MQILRNRSLLHGGWWYKMEFLRSLGQSFEAASGQASHGDEFLRQYTC